MDTEFSYWLCYIKLLVCNSDNNSCQWNLVYSSVPAKNYWDLLGFQNEQLTIIAIFKFHPMDRCAIAEIDEPEQLKVSMKVLIVEDNLRNFSLLAKHFIRRCNLVAYYGFDVETVMQLATNKQVDIIIVKSYGSIYEEVDWAKNILILKSNPETAQIPIILKWGGQFTAIDKERFLNSGVNALIQADPGNINPLIEKIEHTISANNSRQNTISNFTTSKLKNKVSDYQPFKKQKKIILDIIELRVLQFMFGTGYAVVLFFRFLERLNPFRKKYK